MFIEPEVIIENLKGNYRVEKTSSLDVWERECYDLGALALPSPPSAHGFAAGQLFVFLQQPELPKDDIKCQT